MYLAVLVKAGEQISEKQVVHDQQKTESVALSQMSLLDNKEHPPVVSELPLTGISVEEPDSTMPGSVAAMVPETGSFYGLFLRRFQELTAKAPMTVEEMLINLDVRKIQLNEWLKRALEDGQAKKYSKPLRYQWQPQKPKQPSIFDDQK